MKNTFLSCSKTANTPMQLIVTEETASEFKLEILFFNKDNDFVTKKDVAYDKLSSYEENEEFIKFVQQIVELEDTDDSLEIHLLGLLAYVKTYFTEQIDF